MDCMVHEVAKSQTQLRDFHFFLIITIVGMIKINVLKILLLLRHSTGFFRHRQLEDSSRRNDLFQCQELPSPWLRQQIGKTEPQPPLWGGLLFGGGWARTDCLGTSGHSAQVSGMLPCPAKLELRPEHLGPSIFYAFCSKTCFCKYIQQGRNTCQCTRSSIFMKNIKIKFLSYCQPLNLP